jgi:hypothetical protein
MTIREVKMDLKLTGPLISNVHRFKNVPTVSKECSYVHHHHPRMS